MVLGVYSMRDTVGEQFSPLMLATTEAAALRDYADGIGKSSHPEDFALYQLGTFDPRSGDLVAFENPRKIQIANTVEQPIIV